MEYGETCFECTTFPENFELEREQDVAAHRWSSACFCADPCWLECHCQKRKKSSLGDLYNMLGRRHYSPAFCTILGPSSASQLALHNLVVGVADWLFPFFWLALIVMAISPAYIQLQEVALPYSSLSELYFLQVSFRELSPFPGFFSCRSVSYH